MNKEFVIMTVLSFVALAACVTSAVIGFIQPSYLMAGLGWCVSAMWVLLSWTGGPLLNHLVERQERVLAERLRELFTDGNPVSMDNDPVEMGDVNAPVRRIGMTVDEAVENAHKLIKKNGKDKN